MKPIQTRATTFHSTPIVKGFLSQKYSELSKGKEKWTDNLFPPTNQSLYSTKKDHEEFEPPEIPKFLLDTSKNKFLSQFALNKRKTKYQWKRLTDVYSIRELNILKESNDSTNLIDDVLQGELGDCYFLSALAAFGENPDRIRNLFPNSLIASNGVSEVLVYLHGDPTRIVLDDYVPFLSPPLSAKEGEYIPQIAFAGLNPKTKNLWPLLLEKAWAKCNTSYEDIVEGTSAEAFEFLSPAPFDTYYHNEDTQTLFPIIQGAVKQKYIVVSDITETENTSIDFLAKMGLVTNHAYSVIDTAVLKDSNNGNEIRLIKIRNPWGTNEWLGDWSDGSRRWTEEFKETVGLEEKDDGTFWMSYEDFIRFYTTTHVCQIHDDYHFVSKKFLVGNDVPYNMINIHIPEHSSGYFMVNMKNKRIYSNLKGIEEFDNPYCCLTVVKKEDDEFKYIGSDSGKEDRLYVECSEMEEGNYYVIVSFPKKTDNAGVVDKFQYKQFEKMSYRVGVYSSFESLNITPISEKDKGKLDNFLEELVKEDAEQCENKYTFIREGEKNSWRAIKFEDARAGFGYIFYVNNSEAFIRERMYISALENISIIPMLKQGRFNKLETINEQEQVEYEDPHKRKAVENLRENVQLMSDVEMIKEVDSSSEISSRNQLIIQVNVAPNSSCIILLQKNDEESNIDFNSDICFDYLPNLLLAEERFRPKRFMLKYNDKPVEIYECVTEHNTGVLFQYKNRTRDLKVSIKVKFSDLENLYLSLLSDDLKNSESKTLKIREKVEGKFREDNNSNEVGLTIKPGEVKFFEIRAVDEFEKFSYSCHIDYQFNLFKGVNDEDADQEDEYDENQ